MVKGRVGESDGVAIWEQTDGKSNKRRRCEMMRGAVPQSAQLPPCRFHRPVRVTIRDGWMLGVAATLQLGSPASTVVSQTHRFRCMAPTHVKLCMDVRGSVSAVCMRLEAPSPSGRFLAQGIIAACRWRQRQACDKRFTLPRSFPRLSRSDTASFYTSHRRGYKSFALPRT